MFEIKRVPCTLSTRSVWSRHKPMERTNTTHTNPMITRQRLTAEQPSLSSLIPSPSSPIDRVVRPSPCFLFLGFTKACWRLKEEVTAVVTAVCLYQVNCCFFVVLPSYNVCTATYLIDSHCILPVFPIPYTPYIPYPLYRILSLPIPTIPTITSHPLLSSYLYNPL